MESIKNVINMLKPGMFLASIDIKDAFYSVLIFPGHRILFYIYDLFGKKKSISF